MSEEPLSDRALDTRTRRRGSRYVLWGVAVAAVIILPESHGHSARLFLTIRFLAIRRRCRARRSRPPTPSLQPR